jgi:hypothetical protein
MIFVTEAGQEVQRSPAANIREKSQRQNCDDLFEAVAEDRTETRRSAVADCVSAVTSFETAGMLCRSVV